MLDQVTMNIHLDFDIKLICQNLLKQKIQELGIDFKQCGNGEIQVSNHLSPKKLKELEETFAQAGIHIRCESRFNLVHRIKEEIENLISLDDESLRMTNSAYLSKKLNYSYSHLSVIFSESTLSSIENFIILKKIERAKTLINKDELTFSEIAYRLNYSSVSHLSTQFKKTTGLTPSHFKRLMLRRREHCLNTI